MGSLLRPPELLRARAAYEAGQVTRAALRTQEDEAILRALERQRQVGLEILSDGELRRGSWITDMAEAVDGFVPVSRVVEWHGPAAAPEESTSRVVGARLRARQRLTAHESAFLTEHAPGAFKMTVPAPSNFAVVSWRQGLSDTVYASRSEMLGEIVQIVRQEMEALIAEGVRYVQLDSPYYGAFLDQSWIRQNEIELPEVVAADSAALNGLRRPGITLALHICRGNSRSRWLFEGGYDAIAEELFTTLPVDRFLLEYDDLEREGGFEPLRFVPTDKVVVLGLVTTKEPALESQDALRQRIDEAARYVPLERLALSPQCGFASVAAGNLVSEDDQWRKLALVVETARAVWG